MTKDEQIELNLKNIDFKLIQNTIKIFDLTWLDKNNKKFIPSIQELSYVAKNCMERACKSEFKICRMGRFESEVVQGSIIIKYVLTQSGPTAEYF